MGGVLISTRSKVLHSLLGVEVVLFAFELGDPDGEERSDIVVGEEGECKRFWDLVAGILTISCHDKQKRTMPRKEDLSPLP